MTDESPIIGPSEDPRTLVERAAASAMTAAKGHLELEGAELQKIMVVIVASQTGEVFDSVLAGDGFDDAKDLFATLISETVSVGKQLGVQVMVGGLNRG